MRYRGTFAIQRRLPKGTREAIARRLPFPYNRGSIVPTGELHSECQLTVDSDTSDMTSLLASSTPTTPAPEQGHMELRQLRYFVAAAELGSFTLAAASLHLSQPPLSLSISNLERELGVKLFVRSARGVRPTPAGNNLLEYAYRILADVEELGVRLSQHSAGTIGRISIAAVPTLMWTHLPQFLAAYSSSHPDTTFRLVEAQPLDVLDMVDHHTVDFGFLASADNASLAEQYAARVSFLDWGDLPLVGVFPSEPTLPDPVGLEAFSSRTLLLPHSKLSARSLADIVNEVFSARNILPRTKVTVDSIPLCIPMIAAGLGAAILPDLGPEAFGDRRLTVRSLIQPLRPLQVAALWNRHGVAAPVAVKMREAIIRVAESRRAEA